MPLLTLYASADAIPPTGARPVFRDVDGETMRVNAETMRAALTPRRKGRDRVHLFGNVAPVAEINPLGVPVIEDLAQSAGSTTASGRPGALATFSVFPSKNLGCFGDGGAVTARDGAGGGAGADDVADQNEARVVAEVASPQPARLLHQPERSLQPQPQPLQCVRAPSYLPRK